MPKHLNLLLCLALTVAILASFWRVAENNFLIYDDTVYVTENPQVRTGLSFANAAWAFTHPVMGNWHPLAMLSHMLDCSLFGMNPAGHHLVNLLFHIANALLLFLLLSRITGALWPSFTVAALFGLHPLRVESVAWLAERKDVLSGFFFLATLFAYVGFARAKSPSDTGAARFRPADASSIERKSAAVKTKTALPLWRTAAWTYGLALLLFMLGLMSKPMLVTLPFVLLLMDYWPLRRLRLCPGTTVRTLPPLGNTAATRTGSKEQFAAPPLLNTSLQRGVAAPSAPGNRFNGFLLLLLEKLPFFLLSFAASVAAFVAQREDGAVQSLGSLSVSSRLGNAAVAIMTYLEKTVWPHHLTILYLRPVHGWPLWQVLLGAALVCGFTLASLVAVREGKWTFLSVGWFWFLGMLVPVLGLVQVGVQAFADRYTYLPSIGFLILLVWSATALIARYRIGKHWISGLTLLALIALSVRTWQETAYWKNSETLFTRCVALNSDNLIAQNNLASILFGEQRYQEARGHCLEALRIDPQSLPALQTMGLIRAMLDDFEGAKSYLNQAVQLDPTAVQQYAKLAAVLAQQGKPKPAIDFYREFLRLKPDDQTACNNLAWMLATNPDPALRNGTEAVRLAEHACELTQHQEAIFIGTLAAAYAEAGRFEEAVSAAQKALELAQAAGQSAVAQRNRELLELYRLRKPFHET